MSGARFYLWCIFIVCSSRSLIGYGARIDRGYILNLAEDQRIQSPDATGVFNQERSNRYTSVEKWGFDKPREKREDLIIRKNSRLSGDALCRTKQKVSMRWSCQKVASCPVGQQLVSSKQQTVCGREGSSQKICCPYQIDPVKVAQEKCLEYSQLSFVNKTVDDVYEEDNSTVRVPACPNRIENLIVGGEEAAEKEFPHMALIGNKEDDQSYIQWMCGGSLISPRYVLSAAHCNDPTNSLIEPTWVILGLRTKPRYDERVGDNNLYRIAERTNHPRYKPPKQEYDIALFKLDRPAVFSSYIRPLCLALPPNLESENKVTATGWGQTGYGEVESDVLLKVSLDRLDNGTCVHAYEKETTELSRGSKFIKGFDAKIMICVGRLTEKKDTCLGDSGGPIQSRINHTDYQCMWFQEGITSLGSPFCGDGTPAVYTRVSSFLNWIQSIVWPARDL